MHIVVRESRELDEAAAVQDLGLPPADILVLSFSDSDLAMAAAAFRNVVEADRPSLRVVNISALLIPPSTTKTHSKKFTKISSSAPISSC
jgi:cobaltochelatase CobN